MCPASSGVTSTTSTAARRPRRRSRPPALRRRRRERRSTCHAGGGRSARRGAGNDGESDGVRGRPWRTLSLFAPASEGEMGCGDAERAATGRKVRGRRLRRQVERTAPAPSIPALSPTRKALASPPSLPRSFFSLTVPPHSPVVARSQFHGQGHLLHVARLPGRVEGFHHRSSKGTGSRRSRERTRPRWSPRPSAGDHYRNKYCGGGTDDPHYSLVDGTYTALQPCVSLRGRDHRSQTQGHERPQEPRARVEAHLTLQATLLEAERGGSASTTTARRSGNHHKFDSIDTFAVVFAVHVLGSHVFTHEVLRSVSGTPTRP